MCNFSWLDCCLLLQSCNLTSLISWAFKKNDACAHAKKIIAKCQMPCLHWSSPKQMGGYGRDENNQQKNACVILSNVSWNVWEKPDIILEEKTKKTLAPLKELNPSKHRCSFKADFKQITVNEWTQKVEINDPICINQILTVPWPEIEWMVSVVDFGNFNYARSDPFQIRVKSGTNCLWPLNWS